MLGTVGALFAAFLLLQLSYLFGNAAGRHGIGRDVLGIRTTGIRRAEHGGDPLHDPAGGPRALGRARPARAVGAPPGHRGRRRGRDPPDLGAPPPLALRVRLRVHDRAALRPRLHGRGRALPRAARLGSVPGLEDGVARATRGGDRRRRDDRSDLLEPRGVDRPSERRVASSGPSSSTRPIWSRASHRMRCRPCSGLGSSATGRPGRLGARPSFGSATDGSPSAPPAAGSSGIGAGTARWPRSGRRGSWKETFSSILAIASRGDGS